MYVFDMVGYYLHTKYNEKMAKGPRIGPQGFPVWEATTP
jgi:hypothetical protein